MQKLIVSVHRTNPCARYICANPSDGWRNVFMMHRALFIWGFGFGIKNQKGPALFLALGAAEWCSKGAPGGTFLGQAASC